MKVDADAWEPAQLLAVIDNGEKLLNVEFDPGFGGLLTVASSLCGCPRSLLSRLRGCRSWWDT